MLIENLLNKCGEYNTLVKRRVDPSLDEYPRAIEYYQRQLAMAREIGDRFGEGTALWNISLALDRLGKRAEAIPHAGKALKIFEEIESPYTDPLRKQLEQWRKG